MPFITTSLHGTALFDCQNIIFREYDDCETSKKYIKVMYCSYDEDIEYFNVFCENNPMPDYLVKIHDYCKKSSYITYIEHKDLYFLMASWLFTNSEEKTDIMVNSNNFIGDVVNDISSDASDTLSEDAIDFYEDAYKFMMIYKNNIIE